jgi:hypothetical protein
MNRLEHRIERDLRQIADRATPSPDAWETILSRIADQEPDTETEIIMLTEAAPHSTRRWLLLGSAAAAVLAVVVAAVIAFAINSDDEQTPSPVATATPTTLAPTTLAPTTLAPTTLAPTSVAPTVPGESDCPNTYGGGCRGLLAAGTHTTNWFQPVMTYTVPDGWFNDLDRPGILRLSPVNNDPLSPTWSHDSASGDTREIAIYESFAIADGCGPQQDPTVDGTVDAMSQWITSHPGLVTTQPEPVEVGGLQGVVIDISLDPSWTSTCPDEQGLPFVVLLTNGVPGGDHVAISPNSPTRLYLLEHSTGVIVIAVDASEPGQSLQQLAAFATPILDKIHFGA